MLKKVCGAYLTAVAVLVGVHTVVEPLYHVSEPGQPYSPFWNLLNPLMALAIVLGVILTYASRPAADDQAVTRDFVVSNMLFYGLLFVGILFFWNWFNLLNPAFTAVRGETVSLVWIIIDAALPLLAGAAGIRLLRGGAGG